MTKEAKEVQVATYTKAQIISSSKYEFESDLVSAVLDENKKYSLAEVDTLISDYKNKGVK